MTRENNTTVVSGEQGGGKSNETLRLLVDEIVPSGRKGLILDINNEYEKYKIHYSDGRAPKEVRIKRIHHKDILDFSAQTKVECVRVIPYYDKGHPKAGQYMSQDDIDKFWVDAMVKFKGGALLMEDLNNVFGDVLPKRLAGFLTSKRHRDADLFLHMQSIGRVLPKIRQNAEYFRFHRQLDEVEDSESKLSGNFLRVFKVAELIIAKQYNAGQALLKRDENDAKGNRLIRKFLYIHRKRNQIIGGYDERMLYDACMEFVRRNPAEYSFLAREVNLLGKRMRSQADAMQMRALQLVKMFWGN